MTREECIALLAQDMTEAIDLDALIDFYYESTQFWLDSLDDKALVTEYEDWFAPDTPITLKENS